MRRWTFAGSVLCVRGGERGEGVVMLRSVIVGRVGKSEVRGANSRSRQEWGRRGPPNLLENV